MAGIEPKVQVVTETPLTVPGLIPGLRGSPCCSSDSHGRPQEVGVRTLACPVDVSPLMEAMLWHAVNDNDPEHGFRRPGPARGGAGQERRSLTPSASRSRLACCSARGPGHPGYEDPSAG